VAQSGKPLDGLEAMGLPVNGTSAVMTPAPPVAEKTIKRVNPMKIQKMKDRLVEIEAEVAKTESRIAETEIELANFKSTEETLRLTQIAEQQRSMAEKLMAEWEQLSHSIEESEAPVA
jgi:capsule polysaccharide export protein KpsE/RkpR